MKNHGTAPFVTVRLGVTQVLVATLAIAAGCDLFCGEERREAFEIGDAVERLVVVNESGNIDVEAADTDIVSVDAIIRGDDTVVERTLSGAELTIRTDCQGGEVCCNVDYVITVPLEIAAALDTGSGSISLNGTTGDARISTGSGNVVVGCLLASQVSIDTGSGDIEASGLSVAEATMTSGSGSVAVGYVDADGLSVDTGSGDIVATALRVAATTLSTSSGDIDAEHEIAPELLDAETGSGDIEVEVPVDTYDVDTDTGSGDVDVTGITLADRAARRLVAETGSGNITIRGH